MRRKAQTPASKHPAVNTQGGEKNDSSEELQRNVCVAHGSLAVCVCVFYRTTEKAYSAGRAELQGES